MTDNSGINSGLGTGYTKSDIVVAAMNEIGLANYTYDLEPAQLNRALLQLDSLMGAWAARNINVGYPLVMTPGVSNIDMQSNLPATALDAVIQALAIRISPSFGKTVSPELKQSAGAAFAAMLVNLAQAPNKLYPTTLLAGAGNKYYGYAPGSVFIQTGINNNQDEI